MLDTLAIIAAVALFGISFAYVQGCELLKRGRRWFSTPFSFWSRPFWWSTSSTPCCARRSS